MAYSQGDVVIAPASFKRGRRPYLVMSNDRRPFHGEEYTVATITTTERDAAVELTPERLREGRLARYPSYVSPWSLHVVRHESIDKRVARLSKPVIQAVFDTLTTFFEVA